MIPKRITTAADLIEMVIELQRIIAAEGDSDRAKALHEKITTAVFEAEATTLEGVTEMLDTIIDAEIIGPNPFRNQAK